MADSTDIAAFATAMNAFFTQQQTAITDIIAQQATQTGLINTLQNSAGQIDAADQATLNAIQANAAKITTSLQAMDTLTPAVPAPVAAAVAAAGAPVVTSTGGAQAGP
jgi:hypothetical protein